VVVLNTVLSAAALARDRSLNSLTTVIFNAQIALEIHQSVGSRGFAPVTAGGANGPPPDPLAGR
jgi:hypothetical protein